MLEKERTSLFEFFVLENDLSPARFFIDDDFCTLGTGVVDCSVVDAPLQEGLPSCPGLIERFHLFRWL